MTRYTMDAEKWSCGACLEEFQRIWEHLASQVRRLRDRNETLYRFHKKIFGFRDKSELTEDFFAGKNIYLYEGYVHANKARMLSVVNNGELNIDWNLLYDADHYKKVYRERNDQIIKYFAKRPDKLLVLDITRERDTAKFCEFLGIPPDQVIDMPHENKT